MPKLKILVVCTGNICRSPAAELMIRDHLLPEVSVESAGASALVGESIDPQTLKLLEAQGHSAPTFSARQLQTAMVQRADLILAMTRDHRSAVLRLEPRALRRTFTLKEAAALVDHAKEGDSPEDLASYRPFLSLGAAAYDVADPYRHGAGAHRLALTSITRALDRLIPTLDDMSLADDRR